MNVTRHDPRSSTTHGRRQRDAGVALVELLVALCVAAVVLPVAASALTTTGRTQSRVAQLAVGDGEIVALSTWLTRDVRSTPVSIGVGQGIEVGDLTSGCQTTTAQGTGLLRLTWQDTDLSGTTAPQRVSYRWRTRADGTGYLYRYWCAGAGPATLTEVAGPLKAVNGGSPVTITTNGSGRVTVRIVLNAGTPIERTISIDAYSQNPSTAIVAPPTTAPLNPTIALSATTVAAGDAVRVSVTNFLEGEAVSVHLDYTTDPAIGSLVTDAIGAGSTTAVVPLSALNGVHQIVALGDQGTAVVANITVVTASITVGSGGPFAAGSSVPVTIGGFTVGGTVDVFLDEPVGPPLVSVVVTSGSATAAAVTLPTAVTGGIHSLYAVGRTSGRRAVTDVEVAAVVAVTPSSPKDGDAVVIRTSGHRAGETATITWAGGTIGRVVADINGSSELAYRVPDFAAAGIVAVASIGDDGSAATRSVTVTRAARTFTLSTPSPSVAAGTVIPIRVSMTREGVASTFTGTRPITVTGAADSPAGTRPSLPTSATFTNGVATISVRLVAAGTTTLTVSDGVATATVSVTVTAGPVTSISLGRFTAEQLNYTRNNSWVAETFVPVDEFGNAVTGRTIDVVVTDVSGRTIIDTDTLNGWSQLNGNWRTLRNTSTSPARNLWLQIGSRRGNISEVDVTVDGVSTWFQVSAT